METEGKVGVCSTSILTMGIDRKGGKDYNSEWRYVPNETKLDSGFDSRTDDRTPRTMVWGLDYTGMCSDEPKAVVN